MFRGSGCSATIDRTPPGGLRRAYYPPWDSTTLRQPSESFALFSRRQAFIWGGLPICSAQNLPASEREAICFCGLGPDWADTGALAANSSSSETARDDT